MNPDKVICKCKNVNKEDLLKAIGQGAVSFKDVQRVTGAGTKCGGCEKKIRKFLKKHQKGT
jgi:NAD(P)H-nitrite reductase large subunit